MRPRDRTCILTETASLTEEATTTRTSPSTALASFKCLRHLPEQQSRTGTSPTGSKGSGTSWEQRSQLPQAAERFRTPPRGSQGSRHLGIARDLKSVIPAPFSLELSSRPLFPATTRAPTAAITYPHILFHGTALTFLLTPRGKNLYQSPPLPAPHPTTPEHSPLGSHAQYSFFPTRISETWTCSFSLARRPGRHAPQAYWPKGADPCPAPRAGPPPPPPSYHWHRPPPSPSHWSVCLPSDRSTCGRGRPSALIGGLRKDTPPLTSEILIGCDSTPGLPRLVTQTSVQPSQFSHRLRHSGAVEDTCRRSHAASCLPRSWGFSLTTLLP